MDCTVDEMLGEKEFSLRDFIVRSFGPEFFTKELLYPEGCYKKAKLDLFVFNPANREAPDGHTYVELKFIKKDDVHANLKTLTFDVLKLRTIPNEGGGNHKIVVALCILSRSAVEHLAALLRRFLAGVIADDQQVVVSHVSEEKLFYLTVRVL
jgi:hypothetical protein